MTVTTIGYGDLSPQTQSGRIYAIFFIPIGIVMLLKQLSSVAETLFRHKHHQASLTRHLFNLPGIACRLDGTHKHHQHMFASCICSNHIGSQIIGPRVDDAMANIMRRKRGHGRVTLQDFQLEMLIVMDSKPTPFVLSALEDRFEMASNSERQAQMDPVKAVGNPAKRGPSGPAVPRVATPKAAPNGFPPGWGDTSEHNDALAARPKALVI